MDEVLLNGFNDGLHRSSGIGGKLPLIEHKDNIEMMKELQSETVDLIYCDILYGTGRNFGEYQDLQCNRKEIEDFYLPRLKEMHRLLKTTGSIYLQMDTRINHWMRCIMDDIFGYDNFRNEIAWGYRNGGMKKTIYPKKHDVILFYTKSKSYTFNPQRTIKSYLDRSKGYDPYIEYYKDEIGEYSWVYNTDIFVIDNYNPKKQRIYPTQKPNELIGIIIKTSSNENDLVADFFLGSGTTAVVCKEQNRKFIGCDINPKAIQITNERLATSLF